MKNEAIKTLNHYFRNQSNTVFFLGSNLGVEMLSDFFRNGKIFTGDAPDIVILKDDTAIIVEHFEFDSSYTNKKGSSSRIEQARIEREIQERFSYQADVLLEIDDSYSGEDGIDVKIAYIYVYMQNTESENEAQIQMYLTEKYGCEVVLE